MGRFYKINPPCPHCHEEHICWQIQLTDEEQAKLLELLDRILATMTEHDGTEEQLEQHRERITQGGHTC